MKKLIQILSSLAIALSVLWFYFEPSFEPAVTTLAGLAGLIGTALKSKDKNRGQAGLEETFSKRKKVLYIDDDLIRTRFDMLEGAGYKVVPASNANDAIREFKNHKFDAILLDIMMPPPNFVSNETVNNGYETGVYLAKEIKGSLNKDTPIIVLTANPQSSVEADLKDIGISAYLRKPFQQIDLEEELQSSLSV